MPVYFIVLAAVGALAEPPIELSTPVKIAESSFRGIAVRNQNEAWVGGSNGTVMKTNDSGMSWNAVKIPGSDGLDFRDIELPAPNVVVAMAAGPGDKSNVFRSADGGETWTLSLQNQQPKGFFNAIAFWSADDGLLVGDPLAGRLDLYRTSDGGVTWTALPLASRPKLQDGEYGFAASGTNLSVSKDANAYIATGGSQARLLVSLDKGRTWTSRKTPMTSGKDSTGIFSVAFKDPQHGVIVGGDYKQPKTDNGNVAWTADGGSDWQLVKRSPGVEHKACVRHVKNTQWMAVGRTGIVWSPDDGRSWADVSKQSFFTFDIGTDGNGWLAGADGRVARFRVR